MPQPDKRTETIWQTFGRYSGLAFLLPAAMLVGYVIGYFLDKAFGTGFLKIVFLLLGIVSGLIEMVRELNKDNAGQ